MAVKYVNECCDCGLPCKGVRCPTQNIPVWYCDNPKCGEENVDLYEVDGKELCAECALKALTMVHKE